MTMTRNILTLAVGVAASLVGGTQMVGADESTEKPQEKAAEFSPLAAPYVKPQSQVSVGVSVQDGSRKQFGIFDDQRSSGTRALLDADIKLRDDLTGTWKTARIRNLGTENRDVCLAYEKQGDFGIGLGYKETPRIAPYTAYSDNQGLGTDVQIIASPAKANPSSVPKIGTSRDRTSFSAFKVFREDVRLNFSFHNEDKTGTRQWGRGGANEFLLEPIDWNIREMNTDINYTGNHLQLTLGYVGSWFSNDHKLVDTFRSDANTNFLDSHTYLSVPLDNEAHKFFLNGGYDFNASTRSTFTLSNTRALQDEHLQTADIAGRANATATGVTGLARTAAPTHLQGEVSSTLMQMDVTNRFFPNLTLTAQLRYFDEDDRTPAWEVVQVPKTATLPQLGAHSTPISLETTSGKLEATYKLPDTTRVTTGVEHKNQKRDVPYGNDNDKDGLDDERFVPFRTDLDETTYKVQFQRTLLTMANGSLGLKYSDRDGSEYTQSANVLGNAAGKIQPFFISDRERTEARFALDFRPIDRLGLQFNSELRRDIHPNPEPYGRRKAHGQIYSVDADYAINNDWLVNAWYSRQIDEIWLDTGRFGLPASPLHQADKNSDIEDTADTFGLGIRSQLNRAFKIGANLQWSRIKTLYRDGVVTDPGSPQAYPAGVTPLPDIVSNPKKLDAYAEYSGLGPGKLRFDFIHERWRTNDWTWELSDGSPYVYAGVLAANGTVLADGTKVVTENAQSATTVAVRYTVPF